MRLNELKKLLQDAGVQASAPRLAVADYVLSTSDHPTAEEVKQRVEERTPTVATATIYNTLNLFVEKGLLKLLQDPVTHKYRYDCNVTPHFHFYDEESQQLMDLDPSILRIQPNFSKLGESFVVKEIEVVLRGHRKKPSQPSKKTTS